MQKERRFEAYSAIIGTASELIAIGQFVNGIVIRLFARL